MRLATNVYIRKICTPITKLIKLLPQPLKTKSISPLPFSTTMATNPQCKTYQTISHLLLFSKISHNKNTPKSTKFYPKIPYHERPKSPHSYSSPTPSQTQKWDLPPQPNMTKLKQT
ncbi:hypothetical protein M758_9G082300 [Ceratodon purpureus]|nr:hypothetical protein M758_9G082300 [Ceratodon purpureus]